MIYFTLLFTKFMAVKLMFTTFVRLIICDFFDSSAGMKPNVGHVVLYYTYIIYLVAENVKLIFMIMEKVECLLLCLCLFKF